MAAREANAFYPQNGTFPASERSSHWTNSLENFAVRTWIRARGESTAQTPRGAPRQKPRESAERPNVPTENAVRFRARGCESIASEDFLFRAAKILNPPRFRPSTCPNRRNSTRAARFCYHFFATSLFFRALVRSLAPRPRWFGLAGECDALKSRDAGAASSPPRGWTRSSSWRARFSCSWWSCG